jgi:hypothetical protein
MGIGEGMGDEVAVAGKENGVSHQA